MRTVVTKAPEIMMNPEEIPNSVADLLARAALEAFLKSRKEVQIDSEK